MLCKNNQENVSLIDFLKKCVGRFWMRRHLSVILGLFLSLDLTLLQWLMLCISPYEVTVASPFTCNSSPFPLIVNLFPPKRYFQAKRELPLTYALSKTLLSK